MTQRERLVVSAYTGYLMTDWGLFHKFIEKLLGHPVWTHEFADEKVREKIREKIKPEFLALCGRPTGDASKNLEPLEPLEVLDPLENQVPAGAPPGTFHPFTPSPVQP